MVDYSSLENCRAERHRGFESLPFRREDEQRELLVFFSFSLYSVSSRLLAVRPGGELLCGKMGKVKIKR